GGNSLRRIGQVLDDVIHRDQPAGWEQFDQVLGRAADDGDGPAGELLDLAAIGNLISKQRPPVDVIDRPGQKSPGPAAIDEQGPDTIKQWRKLFQPRSMPRLAEDSMCRRGVIRRRIKCAELLKRRHRDLKERVTSPTLGVTRDVRQTVLTI